MSTPTILDFYRANIGHPNAVPFRKFISWNSTSSAVFTVTPASATEMLLIRELGWIFDNGATIASNRRVRILVTQLSPPPSGAIDLILPTANDVFGAMNMTTLHTVGNSTVGVMGFDPPIKLDSTSESIIVRHEDTSSNPQTGGISAGNIRISAIGWTLLIVDY